jgi:hypothetical protein
MGLTEEKLKVRCYSGRTYAERPVSFQWQGTEHEIQEIEKAWLEPSQRHFQVRTTNSQRFHLWYDETQAEWSLVPLAG